MPGSLVTIARYKQIHSAAPFRLDRSSYWEYNHLRVRDIVAGAVLRERNLFGPERDGKPPTPQNPCPLLSGTTDAQSNTL